MSYATMDHAGWMEGNIAAAKSMKMKKWMDAPDKLSDFQKKAIYIIGMVGDGIYNAPIADKIDWSYGKGISVLWRGDLSTWDFDRLTRLVFLCLEARVRLQISPANPGYLRLSLWPRTSEGSVGERHPNIDEAVAAFREYLPADHRIIYREPAKAEAA